MSIQSIPLSQLRASPRNVRKTGGQAIGALAASIAAHGLLQSLVVIPAGANFEVVAGGRRLAALQQLAKDGKLASTDVPCIVTPEAGADEASLAENTIREAMHPADQFEAFRALLDAGMSEDEVAARFSVTVLFVRQRLKLAKVSPKVLAAYRAGKFGLDCVEAFALSNDHAAQERLLKSSHLYPHGIRDALTKGEVESTDKRVRALGGLAAYEAAGGAVRRDLFDPRTEGYVADVKLLDSLVDAKLEERAKKVRAEGWAWVEVGADLDRYRYPSAGDKPDKKTSGAIVRLDYNGVDVVRGLLKPGEKAGKAKGPSTAKPAKSSRDLSFPAIQALQAERTAVVRYELAQNPRVALAALAARLAGEFGILSTQPEDRQARISKANLSNDRLPLAVRDVVKAAPATQLLEAQAKAWKKRADDGPASLVEWLLSQPEKTTHELLALCAALSTMGVDNMPVKGDAGLRFARLAGIDMAEHWTPTPAWLAKQPVAYILAAVREARGRGTVDALARRKGKAAIAAKAAQLLSPRAAGVSVPWLPAPLRTGAKATAPKPARKATAAKST